MTLRAKNSLRPITTIFGASAMAALSLVTASAGAQQLNSEVSAQRFDPAPGPRNFITTRGAETDGAMTWTAAMMANYAYEPFKVTGASGESIPVVENMVTGDVYGSFTIIPQLQLGLKVPVSWVKGQGITASGQPAPGGIDAVGMGDIQGEVKGRFYGNPGELIVLGAYLYGTVPMGNITQPGTYIGNGSGSVGGAVIGSGSFQDFTYALNVGGLWREEATIGQTTMGPEGRWGAAAGYQIGPLLRVVVDAFGSTNFTGDLGANSAELDGGVQVTPLGSPFTISAGGGAGLLRGVGIPAARGFLGLMYSADTLDRDGDGIGDDVDACPDDEEDRDGFEDSDGCPDYDNDQDGLPDDADKCPDKAEDVDNFEDKDGCPEPDNDKDGIPDAQDHCPMQAETVNGVDDLDGCPDAKDADGDGVPDESDKCVDAPEDTDGFEDTDGCPDPDNDKDGVPDNQDECIDQPEDGKGKGRELKDGCPIDA